MWCCLKKHLRRPWDTMSKILNINFISDLDDTASVEHEGHYQNPYSIFFFQLMIIKGLIVKFMKSLFVMREVGSHVDEILFSELAITILTYRTWCLYEELNILASDSMYFGWWCFKYISNIILRPYFHYSVELLACVV